MLNKECQKFRFPLLLTVIISLVLGFTACGDSAPKHITRGEELLKQRKFHEAAMEFRAASDIDKKSAEAHWGLARAQEGVGDINETIAELNKVIELNPNNLAAKTKLGNYFLVLDPPQTEETEKLLNEIFAADPNYIEGHILKASLLSAQKKSEKEVLDVLNQAISLDPNRIESYLSLARFYMKAEKGTDAENTIKKAISINEKSALGYLEYARFLNFADRNPEAETQFKKAVELEPANIEVREALAGFYLAERQLEKAEQAYKELAEAQGNSPEGRTQLADFYATVGREDEAINVFEGILNDAPGYAAARYRLGELYLERKQLDKVNEQVEKLLAANNGDAEALMLRARMKMQDNKAEEAVKDLEDVLKKQPSQKNALYYMVQARLALGQTEQAVAFINDLEKYHPKYIYSKFLKIQASFAAGQSQLALQQANDLINTVNSTYPNVETNAQALEQLRVRGLSARGLANLALNKVGDARTDLQEVLKLSPNSSSAMVNMAKVEAASKNLTGALVIYEKAFTVDKKNFDALNGIISVLKQQKQFVQAQAKIDTAIQGNTGDKDILASLHYLKADVFTAEKNLDATETELQKAMQMDENFLPAYSAYAALLIERNQTDSAIEQYKKVIEKKPSSAVYTLIGILEDARQDFDEAEKNYRKALELTPEAPIPANNLAWNIAANDRGNLDEALTLAQTCVNKNPSAGFYDTLGWVYFKKGLYSPAVEQMKKAVSMDEADAARTGTVPNPGYRLRLGMALASTGDKPNARKEVETALSREKDLSDREKQDARNLLAAL